MSKAKLLAVLLTYSGMVYYLAAMPTPHLDYVAQFNECQTQYEKGVILNPAPCKAYWMGRADEAGQVMEF